MYEHEAKFVCVNCNHTASIRDIELKRKIAAQEVSSKTGICIQVSAIEKTDILRCAACDGKMFAQIDNQSDEWKNDVKRRFIDLVMENEKLSKVDAERLWKTIEQSASFFIHPETPRHRRGYTIVESSANKLDSKIDLKKFLTDKALDEFLELVRRKFGDKKVDAERVWRALETSLLTHHA